MVIDLNENGTVSSNPLWSWDVATVAGLGVFLRLELASQRDEPEEGTRAIQLTMSAEQLDGLILDLEAARATLLTPPEDKTVQ